MDTGLLVYVLSRLSLGGIASFLAIMVWAKTRDTAWMLIVMGVIATYGETIYSILNLFGVNSGNMLAIGSISLLSILLSCFPMLFFIAAFAVIAVRKYRRR